jgi:hypothetical protein
MTRWAGKIRTGKPLPRKPDPRDVLRLLQNVAEDVAWAVTPNLPEIVTPCWIWQKGTDDGGYGFIKLHGAKRWVHRVSFEVFKGPVPEGAEVDHLCFNHSCINPDHLTPKSHLDNARRRRRREPAPF